MINVEFPINEKYRKYLKIEYLFNQFHFFIKQKHSDHITNILFNSYLNSIQMPLEQILKLN